MDDLIDLLARKLATLIAQELRASNDTPSQPTLKPPVKAEPEPTPEPDEEQEAYARGLRRLMELRQ